MRVLFDISGLAFGGAERQVILLARELARQGHAACIYTLTREAGRIHELSESDVELVMDQKRRKLDPAVIRRLRRHIRTWRADIVHGFLFDGNLYSRLAAWGSAIPVLNSERNDNYDRDITRLHRAGYRLTSLLCDGVVANSHAGAQFARRLHRLRESTSPKSMRALRAARRRRARSFPARTSSAFAWWRPCGRRRTTASRCAC